MEQFREGDRVDFTAGPYAGQTGLFRDYTIVAMTNLGRLCDVELISGEEAGKVVQCFESQLKKVPSSSTP